MNGELLLKTALVILLLGILVGILLGMSGLILPLVIIAGIIVGGKILLPLISGRR